MVKKKGKSKSVAQQKLMGMAYAYAKGELKDASPQVKFIAKSFLDSGDGNKNGLKNLKSFASTKHEGLPKKIKESIKIMRFNDINESKNESVFDDLYAISNIKITDMTKDLLKCEDHLKKREIVEDILMELDDLDISQEKYNDIHSKLMLYLEK